MSADQLLHLSRIAKAYRAGVPGCAATVEVLRGLSLRVRAGELVTVEGAPGSGKTTLLLCAAGMLRVDEGEARWPTLPQHADGRPAGIAYVTNRAPAYGFLTVRESLAYAVTVCELRVPGSARSAAEILDLTGLREVADVRRALLGSAQRALLQLAIALVPSPRLVLVDDIARGAPRDAAMRIARCLAGMAASGLGVLHAVETATPVSAPGRMCTLADGRLRRSGTIPTSHDRRSPIQPGRRTAPSQAEALNALP